MRYKAVTQHPHLWVVGLALPAGGTDYGVPWLLLRLPEKGGGGTGETMLPLGARFNFMEITWWKLEFTF